MVSSKNIDIWRPCPYLGIRVWPQLSHFLADCAKKNLSTFRRLLSIDWSWEIQVMLIVFHFWFLGHFWRQNGRGHHVNLMVWGIQTGHPNSTKSSKFSNPEPSPYLAPSPNHPSPFPCPDPYPDPFHKTITLCQVDARDEEGDTALHLALVRQSVSTDSSASDTMTRVHLHASYYKLSLYKTF